MLICFGGYLVQRGYRLGIVEAIATTIFIGFACDYCVHVAQVHAAMHRATRIAPDAAQRGGGGGGGGGGGSRGAERLARTLMHAGPSLYGAALTTVGAALPLLFCYVVVFRRMGEFISVCTGFSFAVALTLIAPAVCVAADVADACRRSPGSARGRGGPMASPKPATSVTLAGALAARLRRRSPHSKVGVAKHAAGGDGLPGTRRSSGPGSSSSWSSSSSSSGACPPYGGSGRLAVGGATNAAIVHI